jgi:hypothetical protein
MQNQGRLKGKSAKITGALDENEKPNSGKSPHQETTTGAPSVTSLLGDVEATLELLFDEIKHRPQKHHRKRKNVDKLDTTMDQAGADTTIGAEFGRYASKAVRQGAQITQMVPVGRVPSKTEAMGKKLSDNAQRPDGSQDDEAHRMQLHSGKYGTEYDLTPAKKTQISHWVRQMMNPHLFSKGVRLEQLQQGLMRLQMMRRGEVTFMLDKFEEAWNYHVSFKAQVLKRYANLTKDMPVQCDLAEPQPELSLDNMEATVAAELNTTGISIVELRNGQDDVDDFVHVEDKDELRSMLRQREKERRENRRENASKFTDSDVQLRVVCRWAKLALMKGNALSMFNSTEILHVCKSSKRRRLNDLQQQVSEESAALHNAKLQLAAAHPDLGTLLGTGSGITASAAAPPSSALASSVDLLERQVNDLSGEGTVLVS